MSKPMKRNAFVLSAALAGLLTAYTPSSWSSDAPEQQVQKSAEAAGKHDAMKDMDHGAMKGMDHDSMKGMNHDSMKGMDHRKMMESQGSDKAKAGQDGQ
ncbi:MULTISPECIES: hypothetical protein [Pseudomonas]|uniref:hypothetical protein n=1 Tax=Pseudomonas TaxID=286 RepID=UPI001FCD8BC9|nr:MULTISPECIES: hypothetical protein [Pseudomonas]MCL8308541.1 hypothetical protein [Pseudomonas putida]